LTKEFEGKMKKILKIIFYCIIALLTIIGIYLWTKHYESVMQRKQQEVLQEKGNRRAPQVLVGLDSGDKGPCAAGEKQALSLLSEAKHTKERISGTRYPLAYLPKFIN
jgi:uncharacterized iron-regulated membrane protein